MYAPNASGNASPIRTIRGSETRIDIPRGIAVDSAGRIYVVTARPPTDHGSILVFAATANGNVAPIQRITGDGTSLNLPHGIEVHGGLIYVTNAERHANSITIYRSNANGNVAPLRTIAGIDTGLGTPIGVLTH